MWNTTNANKQKCTVRLLEKGQEMCINQIHTVKAKNTMKIQFTHFSTLYYLTYLFIIPQ